ncbi:MAG: 50S ribosomal protein L6 [Coprobacillus sp.]|nr:50S ribosomal protein L6 [Coprobacillus sp.]
MSRVGNKHIILPDGVTLEVKEGYATVTGPKGSQDVIINNGITLDIEGNEITVKRESDAKQIKQNHGTTRANLYNAIVGCKDGYKKDLVMTGIGYKAAMEGKNVRLWVGFSHQVIIEPNEGVTISCPSATEISVSGISKQAVGQTAARIREVRPPEPYNAKGIAYKGEVIRRKEGKRAAAGKKK